MDFKYKIGDIVVIGNLRSGNKSALDKAIIRECVVKGGEPAYFVKTYPDGGYFEGFFYETSIIGLEEDNSIVKCVCSITDLMRFGCKCGVFQKEQELKS